MYHSRYSLQRPSARNRLVLELTETSLVESNRVAGVRLRAVKRLGCRVALDVHEGATKPPPAAARGRLSRAGMVGTVADRRRPVGQPMIVSGGA